MSRRETSVLIRGLLCIAGARVIGPTENKLASAALSWNPTAGSLDAWASSRRDELVRFPRGDAAAQARAPPGRSEVCLTTASTSVLADVSFRSFFPTEGSRRDVVCVSDE